MTGKVINLRGARKRRNREVAERKAAENRVKFGRAKSQKALDDKSGIDAIRHLDNHRLDRSEED